MESDISLIEVTGGDDSLLQQIPEDDLLILEKNSDAITAGNNDFFLCSPLLTHRSNGTIAGSSTPSTDYTDKENINANNIEGPKLSIMRTQMKRKKAGGFNLRKSLAWNKAFFTEEGVLDSMELSMITGSASSSCGGALGAIDEEIPAINTPGGDRKNGRCLLPKRGSSTKDNVKFKELSAKDVNRSESKRGSCPRPVASSSAKKPTTSNAAKTVNKEERNSRIPLPKRDPTVISRTLRNAATIRASDTKSNHVAPKAGNNPRMTTLKGSSMNAKSAVNKDVNASKSLKAKTSVQQPRRKLANPVLKTNEGSKAATNSLISKPLSLNNDGTRKVSTSVTQIALPDGRSMLNQTQMSKPSGLRMPSPSMGFFGQKKVSSFQSLPPATSETRDLPKSNIPNVRIAGPSNPVCQMGTLGQRKFVKASNGDALGSSVESVSHDKNKPALKVANIHLGKVNVVGVSTLNKVLSSHGLEKPDVLSLSNPVLEHLGDVSRIHDEISDQLAESKPHLVSFNNVGKTNDLGTQGTPRALDDRLNGAQDCNEHSSDQVEITNSSNCMIERTSPDLQRLGIGSCNSLKRSRTSIEFEHGRFEENVGNDSNGQESCSFDQDEVLETHKMRKAEASDIDHYISNECNNTMQSTSALSSSDSMHIDDEKPTILMLNRRSLQGNGCLLTSQHDYTSCENEVLARESSEICGKKLESKIDLTLIPHSTADACLDSGPVDRNFNYHTDDMVDIRSDMQQNITSFEMERNQDDHGDVGMPYYAEADGTLLITRDLCSSDTENQLLETHLRIGSEYVQKDDKQNSPVLSSVNEFNQLPGFSELQKCCIDLVDVSHNNNQEKCSIDDLLLTKNSGEHNEEIIIDSVIDNSNVSMSECLENYNRIASPEDNSSVHDETHDTRTGDNILEFEEIEASLGSSKCSTAKSSENDKIQSGEGVPETMSKEISSEARMSCDDSSFCLSTKDLDSSVSNDHILSRENVEQYMEAKELENQPSLEMNGNMFCQNENELNSEMKMSSTMKGALGTMSKEMSCDDSSFCLPTKDLDPSVSNDHVLSRENVEQYMEAKDSENQPSLEMNENILCQNENELNSEMKMSSTVEGALGTMSKEMSCDDSSFCLPTKHLDPSVFNDHVLSRENVEQYMDAKELENHPSLEMNGNILCQNGNELNSEMDCLVDIETCWTYNANAQSEARTSCDDSSGPNDHILSRENVKQSMETKELENHKSSEMNGNVVCQNENELNSEMDHLLDSETCSTYDNNAQSEAKTSCDDSSLCSPTKDLGSSVPNDHILSPEINGNILCQSENELNSGYDENAQSMQLRKCEDDVGKQNALGIKTSTSAVPFSEEWLAAFEAAGEEILTMKTGAVQNSPPDKSQPEPGPWSPVKRKNNQEIGPFDCTKCTNGNGNGSQLDESC